MKCPLRLRGISMPGSGPESDAGGSSSSGGTQTEVRQSQAALPIHMQPPTVKLKLSFSFFLKERNGLKFPWFDRHQHEGWAGGKSGATSSPVHTHSHSHMFIQRMVLSATYTLFVSHLFYSLSLDVTDSFLLVIQSVLISCHPVSFTHSAL